MYNNTSSNDDKSVDFAKDKRYARLNSQQPQASTPYCKDVVENNAKSYVDRHFKDRGYMFDTLKPRVLLELALKS